MKDCFFRNTACTTEDEGGFCDNDHCEDCNRPLVAVEEVKGGNEFSSGCTWSDDDKFNKIEAELSDQCDAHEPGCKLYNKHIVERKKKFKGSRAKRGRSVSHCRRHGENHRTSSLTNRKPKQSKLFTPCSPSNKVSRKMSKYEPTSTDYASGDNKRLVKQMRNSIQMYPAILQELKYRRFEEKEKEVFPFKNTPSGNYILEPKQVVYESKALGIVAADPDKISLNVTDPSDGVPLPPSKTDKKAVNQNFTTTCLYTTVNSNNPAAFGSETSDTFSEAESKALLLMDKHSELSLSKMGYITDNCIEWKNLKLPKKSDLQRLIMDNIYNRLNTDTQVKIGDKVCKCHKLVLQSYCAYFNSRPLGQVVELPETEEVTKDIFEVIYQWMLERERESYKLLKRDNILHVFNAAKFFGIKELEDQCWAFMDNTDIFCEDKAFLLYLEARAHGNKLIMELMVPRVQRFFLTLVSSKEFVEFSLEEVCTFLGSSNICIHNEMEVFMAAVRWLDHDWPQRKADAATVMQCVRFGLISPKLLINIRRHPQSPEFHRFADIHEVVKMIDDGVALGVSKCECKSEEEFEKSLKALGLAKPEPRNWSGTDKEYQSYQEFLKDLSHYRSKQRIEKRHSKMKMKIQEVHNDDFLADAVLPPTPAQRIQKQHTGKNLTNKHVIPEMDPREVTLLKNIINEKSMTKDGSRGMKRQLCSMVDESYRESFGKDEEETRHSGSKEELQKTSYYNEMDEAARKIQKAYRGYSQRKIIRSSIEKRRILEKRSQSKATRSKSEPFHLSGLTKSATYPAGKFEENALPLDPSKDAVFILGGSDPWKKDYESAERSSQSIYQYLSSSNSWKHCGYMPVSRFYHSALYHRGKIYIAGGRDPMKMSREEDAVSSKMWCYVSEKQQWFSKCNMLHARRNFNLVASNNRIFAIGGRDNREKVLNSVEMYNVEDDYWEEVAPLNIARAGAGACELRGRIWVAGGLIDIENCATNTVEYYQCQRDKWTLSNSLRFAHAFSVLLPIYGRMYLVGGTIGLPDHQLQGSGKQIDMWDPHTQTWSLMTMLSKPRHAHAATFIKDENGVGHVMVIGGMSSKHTLALNSVECWRVEDDSWVLGVAPIPYRTSGLAALTLPVDIFR